MIVCYRDNYPNHKSDRDDIVLLGGYLTNTKFNRSKGLHWGYRKWPGGGYIMSPDKAKSLTLHLKYNIINVNVDGFLAAFMKIDIKTLITLLTLAAVLGGFYYTTEDRLDHLEDSVTKLERKVSRLMKANK